MIIDCDSHIVFRNLRKRLPSDLAALGPILRFDEHGLLAGRDFPGEPPDITGTTPGLGRGSGTEHLGLVDVEARLRDFERLAIDQQVILPQFRSDLAWSYLIEPKLAVAMARAYNRRLLEAIRKHPDRFLGVALVALQDVNASIDEIVWARENGLSAVALDYTFPVEAHPYGETLGEHRELWPFFAKAAELNMPIYLHATQHGHRALNLIRFQRIGLDFFAPHDAHMNLVSLITSGLLDDFPTLRFIHTESGTGFIKPLVEALDRQFRDPRTNYDEETTGAPRSRRKLPASARRLVPAEEMEEQNKRPPSHYFRTNFYFTIETEEPELVEAVRFLGGDRFLFATDYPHNDPGGSMKWKDGQLLQANAHLSAEEKHSIFCGNAMKLFKLSQTAPQVAAATA